MGQASQYLLGLERLLGEQGVRARGLVRVGRAADSILEIAHEEKTSLIALSTHGRTGLSRWVFGSVTEKVIRSSPAPVLVVRSYPERSSEEQTIRKILLPLDGSDLSLRAAFQAQHLAHLYGAQIVLLHVLNDPHQYYMSDPVSHQMHHLAKKIEASGISVTILSREGDPAAEILDACPSLGIDLIAMSTHGRSGVSRWVMGSVTEKVIRSATTALCIVRG
jgi:nucleotide-binding universal stress UspA family protein